MVHRVSSDAGADVPAIGLGTWRLTGHRCRRAVEAALELGYRHVDTAQKYGNEREVGIALSASDVSREDVFLTTKVWVRNARYDDVIYSTERSLDRLGTDYVDLLLLHWPHPFVPIEETMAAMNRLQEAGTVRHVGVSNFTIPYLEEAMEILESPIVANQVKYHPYHDQDELLEYCVDHEICLTAYSPLAEGVVPGDDRLEVIGEPYGKSATQVALRWLLQQPAVAAIPKAASHRHIEANADVFDFELSPDELAAVAEVGDSRWDQLAAILGLR